MLFREATISDIPELHRVRMLVKENALRNPGLVTHADYVRLLSGNGKGWLCEINGVVAGFAIVDAERSNVWALFVDPAFEQRGIGSYLLNTMMDWHFSRQARPLWLTTAPGTRAEHFYRMKSWKDTGREPGGEIRFELDQQTWKTKSGRHS
jgi:GNAT superfamily N-acetyltransferase